MKTLSGTRVCALFMLLLAGALFFPAVIAQAKDADASVNSTTGFPRRGTVTAETLNVRARPGLFYEVIAKLEGEDKVKVLERQDEWYRIPIPDDAEAWVAARFVSDKHQITGNGVRVRAGTGVAFSAYHTLNQGAFVQPTGETRDSWVRIIPPANATAWVSAQFVELAPPKIDPAAETEPEERQKAEAEEEPEAKTPAGDPDDSETKTQQADSRDGADFAIDEEVLADESGEQVEETVVEFDENERPDVADSAAESETESGKADPKGAVVDLRERVRTDRSSSESRGVKMLPPIRLPDDGTTTEAEKDVRITPPLVTVRRQKKSKRETESTLVYTNVPREEEDGGAEVEVDTKADAERVEVEMRHRKTEERGKARRASGEQRKAKADKLEAPTVFRVSGIVISLGERANEAASHVVVRSTSGRMAPVAYLRSQNVDLAEWEGRKLHVYGKRIPCDWSKPLVAVSGVLIAR